MEEEEDARTLIFLSSSALDENTNRKHDQLDASRVRGTRRLLAAVDEAPVRRHTRRQLTVGRLQSTLHCSQVFWRQFTISSAGARRGDDFLVSVSGNDAPHVTVVTGMLMRKYRGEMDRGRDQRHAGRAGPPRGGMAPREECPPPSLPHFKLV